MDDDREPIVVEIDETKYFQRKYHRCQWTEGHWVFGAIERESGCCLMTEVPGRCREIFDPIIRRWILPGSRIISDGWRSYDLLNQLEFGEYGYDVVHQRNFVDPADETIHTQNIENTWQRPKRKLKRQYGISQVLFTLYLSEFLWRNSMET